MFAAVECWYLPRYVAHKKPVAPPENGEDGVVTVVSSNVRTMSPTDLFKKSWFYRADLLMRTVGGAAPDVVGFQEVTRVHYKYLRACLQGYDSVICYRDSSPIAEGCPVFYNTAKFELVDKNSFWLSETPDEMSRGWDAAFNRVCSYVILREKATGKELVVFNLHLDHVGKQARENSIKLILEKIEAFGGLPCVIMGDFNVTENTDTYRTATELFDDAKYRAAETDSGATYQYWGGALNDENIDYFMVSKTGLDVLQYQILRDTYDGVYVSDHFPIKLKIKLD